MKRKFETLEISIILLNKADVLTISGEDDAIIKDDSWKNGTQESSIFGS